MSRFFSSAANLEPFRVNTAGPERRRVPRYEALGPGELRSTTGELLGSFRLVDESDVGLGCVSPAVVEVGQVIEVRIGSSMNWRPAVVVTATPCGNNKRVGVMFPARSARLAA